jgi:imidazolonepropionase-like amidohydrolase
LAGHVPAGFTPEELSDSGLKNISHLEFLPDRCLVLFDSTARANHASPPTGCGVNELDQLLRHLHGNDVWLDPTIGSFRRWAPRAFPSILAGFGDVAPLMRKNQMRILAGTDLGTSGITPGASLHDEIAFFVDAGFSPLEALRSATTNPAAYLGLSDSLGAVKPGYVADLVLLDGDPLADIHNTRRIAAVIRSGVVVRQSSIKN